MPARAKRLPQFPRPPLVAASPTSPGALGGDALPQPASSAAEAATAPNRRYLKATLAGSAGGLVALLFFLLEQRPELAQLLLERVVIAWGPQFIILLLLFSFLYLLADRYAPRLIAAQSETALALQNLARAVEQLVTRENSFQREQDVLLNHVARRVEALHELLTSTHRALNGHLARFSRRAGKTRRRKPAPVAPRPRAAKGDSRPAT